MSRASTSRARSASSREAVEARRWAETDASSTTTRSRSCARAPSSGWGVAVVCGTGINCVGVAPDGRHARFPALGRDHRRLGRRLRRRPARRCLGRRAQRGRPRAEDVARAGACPAHFGLATPDRAGGGDPPRPDPAAAARSSCRRSSSPRPRDDEVAAGIVERLAGEVVAMARVALERLELTDEPVEVLLGGGLLQSGRRPPRERRSRRGCGEVGARSPCVTTPSRRRSSAPPCSGSTSSAPPPRRSSARARGARGRSSRRRGEPMADVRFERATRVYAGQRRAGGRRARPRTSRTASSWSSSARRAPARRRRCGCSPGSRRSTPARVFIGDRDVTVRPAEEARRRDGVPELRALPVPDRRAEHRLPAQDGQASRRPSASAACARWRGCSGSSDYLERKPGQLSGGERQRRRDGPRDRPRSRASS